MEEIKIDKDGSMTIPIIGNMKITVEMTEGLFEEFMLFRKDKAEFEKKANSENERIKRLMDELAKSVIDAIELYPSHIEVDNCDAAEKAVQLANDWFC